MRERYGLYRAVVTQNVDPIKHGRIKVLCPDLYGEKTTGWVEPCFSVGSTTVPPLQAVVWIACEQGDPDHPVWMGVLLA